MKELNYIITDIKDDLEKMLENAGIYYRIFARQKSDSSIEKKLSKKCIYYTNRGKKMQDIFGIRIVFYFLEDVEIFNTYLHKHERYLDDSTSQKDIEKAQQLTDQIENLSEKMFMPTRLNLIFQLDENNTKFLQDELKNEKQYDTSLIDNTYEVQLRTVLSEGWHEVEHDLRYKSKDEGWWKNCEIESRMLNGIYATLETSERALDNIFSTIAYKNYKSGEWSAMMRNHLKIHTKDSDLSSEFITLLNNNKDLAKAIFKVSRKEVIEYLLMLNVQYPLTMDNLLILSNRLSAKDNRIIKMEKRPIKDTLDKHFAV